MKILNILAQKPHSTGSGVYLSELVKSFHKKGLQQGVVAGVYIEDQVELPQGVAFYPVYFDNESLPFKIPGMSDEMPYQSTKYSMMTESMVEQFKEGFLKVIDQAILELNPDVILCHHLYLLTALVRDSYPDKKVFGICHNTDIRQFIKTDLKRDFISKKMRELDAVFVPGEEQRRAVLEHYAVAMKKIQVIGTGYNQEIFYPCPQNEKRTQHVLTFVGKISVKKGVESLIKSLDYLPYKKEELRLDLIGSAGDQEEYKKIKALAAKSTYEIRFLGAMNQEKLAKHYSNTDLMILPSFSEGIPLVTTEAMACGAKVVVSNLPGLKEWFNSHIQGAPITYVDLPPLTCADEAEAACLPDYEKRLSIGIIESLNNKNNKIPSMKNLTWDHIADIIIGMVD